MQRRHIVLLTVAVTAVSTSAVLIRAADNLGVPALALACWALFRRPLWSLGAFGLAVAANVHGFRVAPYRPSPLLVLSLAIWPVMTAVAAFVAALIAAFLFSRVWRRV